MKLLLYVLFILLASCRDDAPETPDSPFPGRPNERATKTFAVQYNGDLNYDFCKRDVFYLDLFDYSKEEVSKCKKMGATVIAYFSSQYEKWRNDADKFKKKDIGNKLPKWKGEYFVDTNSTSLRELMLERLILAKEKGFDGADVDNIDSYSEKTGFNTTIDDSFNYVQFFSNSAHKLDLKFSLKNGLKLLPLIEKFKVKVEYFQNESCYKYKECWHYNKVISPVFIIHYDDDCPKELYLKGSTILKDSMDEKDELCN